MVATLPFAILKNINQSILTLVQRSMLYNSSTLPFCTPSITLYPFSELYILNSPLLPLLISWCHWFWGGSISISQIAEEPLIRLTSNHLHRVQRPQVYIPTNFRGDPRYKNVQGELVDSGFHASWCAGTTWPTTWVFLLYEGKVWMGNTTNGWVGQSRGSTGVQ